MRRLAFALVPLLVALVGRQNPVDALVMGKWVRHWQTLSGEDTATMCLPAQTPDEIADYRGGLPERVRALHEAGATVVAVTADLSAPHESDAALREAASSGFTLFARTGDGAPFAEPSGTIEMDTTAWLSMVLGAPPAAEQPLSVAAYALHTGGAAVLPHTGPVLFMPYEVPFLHWDEPAAWAQAEGRVVFIGACKADRVLSRFGRQPAPVAHSEIVETLLDEAFPWEAPGWVDAVLAWIVFGVAYVARFRGSAVLVGAGAVLVSLLASLGGVWFGLSGLALGALAGWLAQERSSP